MLLRVNTGFSANPAGKHSIAITYRPETDENRHYDDLTRAKHCFGSELEIPSFSDNVLESGVS